MTPPEHAAMVARFDQEQERFKRFMLSLDRDCAREMMQRFQVIAEASNAEVFADRGEQDTTISLSHVEVAVLMQGFLNMATRILMEENERREAEGDRE